MMSDLNQDLKKLMKKNDQVISHKSRSPFFLGRDNTGVAILTMTMAAVTRTLVVLYVEVVATIVVVVEAMQSTT